MDVLNKNGLIKLWAKIKKTFATKADLENKLGTDGGTIDGDLNIINGSLFFNDENILFGQNDGGEPLISSASGNRVLAIGKDGTYDGDYCSYIFPDKNGTVALLDDIEKEPIIAYSTRTTLGAFQTAGSSVTKSITLNTAIQNGDRVKVYLSAGTTYTSGQGGIIEFEAYTLNSMLIGTGSTMSGWTKGASYGIIGVEINSSGATATTLNLLLWALTTTQYAAASTVYLEKVEIIR